MDAALIKKTAGLAQLEVTDAEADALVPRFQNFLSFVAAMDEVDTPPDAATQQRTTTTLDAHSLRDDQSRTFENQQAIMANMPLQENGYLRVPRVGEDTT